MFLQATLTDGTRVISEFTKLASGQRYVTQVLGGQKPFNGWEIVGRVHPVSGEPVLLRRRRMISGRMIAEVEVVKPRAGQEESHGLDPANFESEILMQVGRYGLWTCKADDTVAIAGGAVAGVQYPIHRDPDMLSRYVIIATQPAEVRYEIPVETNVNAQRPRPTAEDDGEEASSQEWDEEAWGDEL